MTRTVQLPAAFDGFVDRMIESGRYGSTDDLVAEALGLLERQAEEMASEEALLLDRIDDEAGDDVPADDVFAELREKVHAAGTRHAAE